MAAVVSVREGIDFAETLHAFCTSRLTDIIWAITSSTEETFPREFPSLACNVVAEFVALCQFCFSDGQASS